MKSPQEFYAFYQSTLKPFVESLEEERKKLVKLVYIAAALAVGFLILYGSMGESTVTTTDLGPGMGKSVSHTSSWVNALFYVAIAGGAGYYFWYRPKWKDFTSRFKTEVISRIVTFTNENLTYNPTEGISRIEFLKSSIFDTGGDRFLSEDLVTGKVGNTSIKFSEVHTQDKKEIKSEGVSAFKRWVTLFRGVVFIADFNKHFNGRTVVLTDQAEKNWGSIGSLFQKMNSSHGSMVKMENTEFEKAFVVYSTDAIEAHYILTPTLMERIVALRSKFSGIQLAFYNSVVFISIPYKENLFEANLFESLTFNYSMEKYHYQVKMFMGIVEELNLNTRIWTKE